ncbi:MAG: PhnD/SsuA/transferrin family substrate-binding protein [Candidatus Competibacteraceae bacterium]
MALREGYGIHDLRAGLAAAVVEGMCNDQTDIAWFGAVTFDEANDKCGVDLLAVDVTKGDASYYSGIFVGKDSGMTSIADLKGKSMAFGSPNSTSSFNFPSRDADRRWSRSGQGPQQKS